MSNTNSNVIRTEFAAAIQQIATERKIPVESIYDAISQALVSAYRKQSETETNEYYYFVDLNHDTGEARIMQCPALEHDEETGEITKWDETKAVDVTPAGFGRIAAQTAKQVILQKIRQSEKDQIISDFQDRIGEVVTGQVLRMNGRIVIVDIGRGYAWMPPEEQMRGEFYRLNQRMAVLIKEIRQTHKGDVVIVSRADSSLVSKLFAREVPEVASGAVEIVRIAREAGVRTKLSVRSTQDGVDPVGSCVGQRGVRVQKVIEELNNEKIDIIPHTEDQKTFLQGALAPAENLKIEIDDKNGLVTVTAPDDQLSLAIGKGGQNVRLAAKLTGYQITIKSASGQVQSKVTGSEEYEIDTFKGLTPESRTILIEHKLTTVNDLERFQDKWMAMADLSDEQKAILKAKVEEEQKARAEHEASFDRKRAVASEAPVDDSSGDKTELETATEAV
ncbi:MAG: transcription termination factor NusA [Patescibacteria group bacterium]